MSFNGMNKDHYDHFAPDQIPATQNAAIIYQNTSLKQDL